MFNVIDGDSMTKASDLKAHGSASSAIVPCESAAEPVAESGVEPGLAVRTRLAAMIRAEGKGYAALSRLIGRNPAYIQQFIKRGIPRRLTEEDRRKLAAHFGVSEVLLGGPAPRADQPAISLAPEGAIPSVSIPIPWLEMDGGQRPPLMLDQSVLAGMGRIPASCLAAIEMRGDSMAPTLMAGDHLLVNLSDTRPCDGLHVLESDAGLTVKRLSLNPVTGRVTILSDNGAYPSVPDCDPAALRLRGRVVWMCRALP